MIQGFTQRVLDGLDRIYGIIGPISRVDSLDIAPPVLVHDVSREAELSAGFFTNVPLTITTAGAGAATFASLTRDAALAIASAPPIASQMAEKGYTPSDVDVWIYGWWAIVAAADSGDFAHLRVGIAIGTPLGGANSRVLSTYNAVEAQPIVSGGTLNLNTSSGAGSFGGGPFGELKLPLLLPDDPQSAFLIEAADDAGGAMTAGAFWRCWVGPKGAPPPAAG